MSTGTPGVVIVGGGLAGVRTAEALRRNGYKAPITVVGAERHAPYDRPPLSKQLLLGTVAEDRVTLRTAAELASSRIELRLGLAAVALRREDSTVELSDGSVLPYERLVVATGARARTLPGHERAGVHALRTLDDALAVRAALATAANIVIVGGGFIGAEVASAARARGVPATVIEASANPLSGVLGPLISQACADLHSANGTRVLTDAVVAGFEGDEAVRAVSLADGRLIPADLVVCGVGVEPNVEWLADTGLDIDGGLRCDAAGRADSAGTVYGVGDVARWWHPLLGTANRIEHWAHAVEQAESVATTIAAGEPAELSAVPYVWSDQYGVKIQIVGRPDPGHEVTLVEGSLEQARFLALYTAEGGVRAAVAFGRPRLAARARPLVGRAVPLAEAISELGLATGVTACR
ncbi:NAD(P)/FAD-dependent oxidoreductase [Nonomuraea pusilla]|uniref:3-phenylpropionate/trans-cinnamate dioxygenase ferredoxin reductase subunit n=1 Tax=Nonomuraea pusilla TaxID=46177 RepID=A0A1H8EIG8_9ACTN|nr:FAD/NAD(P)-binding oxidoreductase [Nonomuraea pusilla]SEN19180.1 3-phenylpropionate/trans-cinnamate dioxygenase ferredoxin reductase subunit [Nonomuraea pusilla]